MSSTKRASSPAESSSAKRTKPSSPSGPQPKSLHQWLHPHLPPPLMAHSPPLHHSSSTFLSFSISFLPPAHVTNEAALTKEVKRIVRELNVVGLVGDEAMEADDGAFQDGEGRISSSKGKERAREPDHRMWAVRTLCLKDGKDGTKGEDDYQLLEVYNDDGEKFGGDRVLRVMKEEGGVDMITTCVRWYGGDMIGPVRFQHIGITARTSIHDLTKQVTLCDLRQVLEALDEEIEGMRNTINPPGSPLLSVNPEDNVKESQGKYDAISDTVKLERLIAAKGKTKALLEDKIGWIAMERARVEEDTGDAH